MSGDVVIIGAGLSGLIDAILLAETGRKVVVLEQHTVPGGYLQQFQRKGTVFDVGFHYMGSTLPGRCIRRFLEHLGVWDRIRVIPFPEDGAIELVSGKNRFALPPSFERFHEKARRTWPHQGDAIDRFIRDVDGLCALFMWFDLKRGVKYRRPAELDLPACSVEEYISSFVEDPSLREILCFPSFNIGLHPREIPWVKYALSFRSNFDLTSRIEGGGGALVSALVERGKELGVEYRLGTSVEAFTCEGRQVRSVLTARGERFPADLFIAAFHPKEVVRRIQDRDLPAMFKERILEMKESRGAVQVFLRLREPPRSFGPACLLIRDAAQAAEEIPIPMVFAICPSSLETTGGGPRVEALTFTDAAPFSPWADRPVSRRGPEYERLKEGLARRMIGMIAAEAPELPGLIEDIYASTPLTGAWYTRSEHGGVFGVSHDVTQQGGNRPQARTRLKNLFFTGHSIMLPGICGVFVNSFGTCAMIRGDEVLFDSVAT